MGQAGNVLGQRGNGLGQKEDAHTQMDPQRDPQMGVNPYFAPLPLVQVMSHTYINAYKTNKQIRLIIAKQFSDSKEGYF